jgi:hypothetical protein
MGAKMPEQITRSYPVSGYDRVSFRTQGKIQLIQGEEEGVTISGDADTLDRLKVEVSGGELVIRLGSWLDYLFFPRPAYYTIKVRNLREFQVSGSADLESNALISDNLSLGISGSGKILVDTITAEQLKFSTSGSSKVEIHALKAKTLQVTTSGSGRYEFSGNADQVSIHSSGTSEVEGLDLATQQAEVRISGSGSVDLQVEKVLDVRVSGSGKVQYLGEPQVNQSVSGSATIRKIARQG